MRENFLVFGEPEILEAEIEEVVDSLRKCWIGTGPKVQKFQDDFAKYKGVDRAVALASCTAGLHLGMLALDLGPGDEVITTPMTFCATVNAIIHTGATPVLADVDPKTGNIDPTRISERISERTRALVIVHYAGRPCDMDAIMDIARGYNLKVIEDCAHAVETQFGGQAAGTFGDIGVFSFYATKNVVTGEGGMVIGRDPKVLDRIQTLSLHGLSSDAWKRFSDSGYKHYLVEEVGYKANMTDLNAAIGIHQLARVEDNWLRRKEIWCRYVEALSDLPFLTAPTPASANQRHAYHLFAPLVREDSPIKRDNLLEALTARNIGCGVHYTAIPEHPLYQEKFHWKPEDFPVAVEIGRKTISLPLSPKLSYSDVESVISALQDSYDEALAKS